MTLFFDLHPFGSFRARLIAFGVVLVGGFLGYAMKTGFQPASSQFWMTLLGTIGTAWWLARAFRYFDGEIQLSETQVQVPVWGLRGKVMRTIPLTQIRAVETLTSTSSIILRLQGDDSVLVKDSLLPRDPKAVQALLLSERSEVKPLKGISSEGALFVHLLMTMAKSHSQLQG